MKYIFLVVFLIPVFGFSQGDRYHYIYEKARALSAQSYDSSLVLANRSLNFAKTNRRRYQSFYLMGLIAGYQEYLGLSVKAYKKALSYAPNDEARFVILNCIAGKYILSGSSDKSEELADSCINFFSRANLGRPLSFALDTKANILMSRGDKACFALLRRSVKLKPDNEKKDGFEYLAKAHAKFGALDSAIFYQRLCVRFFDKAKLPEQKIKLAKLLTSQGGQKNLVEAKSLLDGVKTSTNYEGVLFWAAKGAYLAKVKSNTKLLLNAFGHCDELLIKARQEAKSNIQKKFVEETAKQVHADILKIRSLPKHIRERYQGQVNIDRDGIELYCEKIKFTDNQLQLKMFGALPGTGNQSKGETRVFIIIAFFLFLAGFFAFYRLRVVGATAADGGNQPLSNNQQRVMKLVQKGYTYAQISVKLDMNLNTVKSIGFRAQNGNKRY